jgi:hypothetical protein
MDPNSESTTANAGEISSLWVLGARLTWVIIGPAALLGITYGIVSGGAGWLTGFDAAFGIVAGLMLLGRWAEQRSGSAVTLTGEPATFQQLKRYVMMLILVTAAIWVVANLVGNHVLN